MEAQVSSITPGTPVSLNLQHYCTRLHVTDMAKLTFKNVSYMEKKDFNKIVSRPTPITGINVPTGGAYYFLNLGETSEISLDDKPYDLALPDGKTTYEGISYTLIPLSSGTVKPGE